MIHVLVEGGPPADAGGRPITITDFGAPRNGPVVGRLIQTYRDRGWAFRAVRASDGQPPRP